jgi:hypothetical protein
MSRMNRRSEASYIRRIRGCTDVARASRDAICCRQSDGVLTRDHRARPGCGPRTARVTRADGSFRTKMCSSTRKEWLPTCRRSPTG